MKKRSRQVFCLIIFFVFVLFGMFPQLITIRKDVSLWSRNGKYNYRIPGIIALLDGTLIAYCEERFGTDDWSSVNIVEKISSDGGKSWSNSMTVISGTGHTVNNPVMIADNNKVHLLFVVEYGLEEMSGGYSIHIVTMAVGHGTNLRRF